LASFSFNFFFFWYLLSSSIQTVKSFVGLLCFRSTKILTSRIRFLNPWGIVQFFNIRESLSVNMMNITVLIFHNSVWHRFCFQFFIYLHLFLSLSTCISLLFSSFSFQQLSSPSNIFRTFPSFPYFILLYLYFLPSSCVGLFSYL
jgi:hypothetical protein